MRHIPTLSHQHSRRQLSSLRKLQTHAVPPLVQDPQAAAALTQAGARALTFQTSQRPLGQCGARDTENKVKRLNLKRRWTKKVSSFHHFRLNTAIYPYLSLPLFLSCCTSCCFRPRTRTALLKRSGGNEGIFIFLGFPLAFDNKCTLLKRAQQLMEEEEDENEGEGATEDTNEDDDEPMDEDEVVIRVPGHNGVPPLPELPQPAKVNGVVHRSL
jgi:hypothetical protein